jgi:hypothetical protein
MNAYSVLKNLLNLPAENEVVEFKEAKNPISCDKLQKELSNQEFAEDILEETKKKLNE